MSPLWNNALTLQMDAEQLRATWHPGWALRQPPVHHQTPLTQPLPQALDALFTQLQTQAPLSRASLRVLLADAHVHLDVVPGDFASYSTQQLQAIAEGCVAEMLGDAAASQQVRWQLQPDLRHLLLCAIGQPTVDAVVQAATQHGLQLASMQPAFCHHWAQHSALLPKGSGVLTLADHGCGLIACAERGSITALSTGRWSMPTPDPDPGARTEHRQQTLDLRVDRLLASLGAPPPEGFVLVARDPAALTPSARWTVRPWQEATA